MNIIIPLGGKGERFSKQGYTLPKSLIKVLGKEIICWTLDHLDFSNVHHIYIPYHSVLQNYRFEEFLKCKYPNLSFVFYCLPRETSGATETILLLLEKIQEQDRNLPFLCVDGDNFFLSNITELFYQNKNKNIVFCAEDSSNQECFSFLECQETKINKIVEKQRISNHISVGGYGSPF